MSSIPRTGALAPAILALAMAGCTGDTGEQGPAGPAGPQGDPGADGTNGSDGTDGTDGTNGTDGTDGATVDPNAPLSSMVAISFRDGGATGASNLADYVTSLVELYAEDDLPATLQFPLAAASTDTVRTIPGLHASVVARWMDPLTYDDDLAAPRFGANADYIAYFGDGWDDVAGSAPQYSGADGAGWVWVNHEYISNSAPSLTSAPSGQHMHLASVLKAAGVLANDIEADSWDQADVDTYTRWHKRNIGGAWFRIVQDPASGDWSIDLSASAVRYTSTSDTLTRIEGFTPAAADQDDAGNALPAGVASGIMGDCSGAQTPWGTILTAEENVQSYYGDLETAWTSQQKFVTGNGFDPGAAITLDPSPSSSGLFGRMSDSNELHARDLYGFLSEIDPGQAPDEYEGKTAAGTGHMKYGFMGRARWENATFVTGPDWGLIPNQPIVIYAANDRRSGRIYKYVTDANYTAGMSKAQIRGLLASGTLYVAHFAGLDNATGDTLLGGGAPTAASPGAGQWIELSTDSTDVAPNATALGAAGTTVGVALQDNSYNGIGGFADDNTVRAALFTAAMKVGVMELNRPEDLEWNANDPSGTPRLYVAFTKNGRQVGLDQDGVLYDPADHDAMSPKRPDPTGSIFVIEEDDPTNPGGSTGFDYFQVWHGSEGTGPFDAANPDNLAIDANGGVWFGTDGNWSTNGHADGIYYLDLDPSHAAGQPQVVNPTYGLAFRVLAAPSDAEATGPAFSAGMGTLFFNVQHPGEGAFSSWPNGRRSRKAKAE